MEEFTQKSARKVEAHFGESNMQLRSFKNYKCTDDSLDDLLESMETVVSSQIDSVSTTVYGEVENILRDYTSEF